MAVTVLSDAFTHTDSALSLGTATVRGGAWTVGNLGDVATLPTWGITSNQGYLVTGGATTHRHAWLESGASNGTLSLAVTLSNPSNGVQQGILFRRVDGSNFWIARVNNSTDLVDLLSIANGSATTMASVAGPAMGDGATVTLAVEMAGAHIRVKVGGTTYIDLDSNVNQYGTKHGLVQASATGNGTFDTFSMTIFDGGASASASESTAVGTVGSATATLTPVGV